jgi:hypothetical protein
MKNVLKVLIVFVIAFCFCGCKSKDNKSTLGVWWWDDTLGSEYLDYAKENNVTEIYYCSDNFNNETASFIKKSNAYNIKVYWLAGEYKWLSNPFSLYQKIERYYEYQEQFPNNKFDGIHLDIEPHQDPDFNKNRKDLITRLIKLAKYLKENYSDITFDYDIPFWLHDTIYLDNEEKAAYSYMIDIANRVFIMSYRDDANSIYSVASEEVEYAKNKNKILILGVETKSDEGDNVSFMEEGKQYMNNEIKKVRKLIPENYGISIHQIKTWYNLKEEN